MIAVRYFKDSGQLFQRQPTAKEPKPTTTLTTKEIHTVNNRIKMTNYFHSAFKRLFGIYEINYNYFFELF